MNDDQYWQKEFMKGETPEISDESGTEYWGNLLSIIRKDNRQLTKAKAKEENSKAMRYEPFHSLEPQEVPPQFAQALEKVQDDIRDISSIRDEQSKNFEDDESVYNPDKAGDSFYAKKTGEKFYEEATESMERPRAEEL